MKKIKDHILTISVVLLALAGVAFIGYGFLGKQTKPEMIADPLPSADVTKVIAQDRERLTGKVNSHAELAVAVRRLAVRRDPMLKEKLEEYLQHPSVKVREAAVEGVGYFAEAGYLKVLSDSLASTEKEIRLAALRGLGHKRGDDRSALVRNFLRRPEVSDSEKVEARIAWLQVANEESDRQQATESLLSTVSGGAGGPYDRAALELMVLVPRNDRVAEIARAKLAAEGTSSTVVIRCVRYLTSMKDAYLDGVLPNLATSPHRGIQLAVLDALRGCPNNWDGVLDSLEKTASATNVVRQINNFKAVSKCK